mgnify:CR=1 FL=1
MLFRISIFSSDNSLINLEGKLSIHSPCQTLCVAKDIWAGLKNVVGGEISEYTRLQAQSREQAISRMIENAKLIDADAVVNVRITTSMIMQGCSEIMAYGTAVMLD